MKSTNVIEHLVTLRRRLRALLVIDGLARWAAALCGAIVGLSFLDWWVQFPWFVRIGFLAMGAGWTVVWGYRRVIRPLFHPLALDQLALSLRVLEPDLRDRLAGLVAYQRGAGDGSAQLWDGVLSETTASASRAGLAAGLNPRRTLRSSAGVLFIMIILSALTHHYQSVAVVSWGRLATPLAPIDWPRSTGIEPISGDAKIALGEPFTVAMRLSKGDDEDKRAFVRCRIGNRPVEELMMRRDPDGIYRRMVENVTAEMVYWFRAGDDDTSNRANRVHVVNRPTVTMARLLISPPEYSPRKDVRKENLTDGRSWAVRGSNIRLEVTGDKTIRTQGEKACRVTFEGGMTRPLLAGEQAQSVYTEFMAEASGWFEIALVDEDGFESRGGQRYELDVRRDEPPTVTILEPGSLLEVLPRALIAIQVKAVDDVGVNSLRLHASVRGGEYTEVADLSAAIAQSGREDHDDKIAHYEWDLTPLQLNAGDFVDYLCEVTDGFSLGNERHEPIRSRAMRLSVVSQQQFFARLRQDFTNLRIPIRRLLLAIESIKQETLILQNVTDASWFDPEARASIQRMLDEARRVAHSMTDTESQAKSLVIRGESNRASEHETMRQARMLAHQLEGVRHGPTYTMVEALTRVEAAKSNVDRSVAIRRTSEASKEAAESLRKILDDVDQWDDFDAIVRRLHELIDRQEALGRVTGRLREDTVAETTGKAVRQAGEQEILKDDATRLLAAITNILRTLSVENTAVAQSLERAQSEGTRRGVIEQMSEASESIRAGRWTAARSAQEHAESGLRAMQMALAEKPRRELELLTRKVRDLRQRLGQLIKAQEEIIKLSSPATSEEEKQGDLVWLADRQNTLEGTTRRTSNELVLGIQEGEPVRDELLDAAHHMALAADLLRAGSSTAAVESEQSAHESLKSAVALLDRAEDKAMAALAEESLAAIVEGLQQVARTQRIIQEETSKWVVRLREDALSRADGLAMNRLSKREDKLRGEFQELQGKIGGSVVYGFMAGEVSSQMVTVSTALKEHRPDDALTHENMVLHYLELMIAAAKESATQAESRFVSDEATGGGADAPTPSSPIPSLAELRALRQLQIDLNDRTQALHRRLPEPSARDAGQQDEVMQLGQWQRRIHEMARQMVEQAGGGQ